MSIIYHLVVREHRDIADKHHVFILDLHFRNQHIRKGASIDQLNFRVLVYHFEVRIIVYTPRQTHHTTTQ